LIPLIGYARVSTEDQPLLPQSQALKSAGCVEIHEEQASGGNRARPVLARVLERIGKPRHASPAMNRRNALFAGHGEGGRNWARFASLIGTCKMNGVEPYAYLRDLFTKLANGHLARDIDELMPWACARSCDTQANGS
jgi:hypothetical protein